MNENSVPADKKSAPADKNLTSVEITAGSTGSNLTSVEITTPAEKNPVSSEKGGAVPKKARAGGKRPRKIRVIFVCTGNTCRSPMAEAILKEELARRGQKDAFTVTSAGLNVREGDKTNPKALEALSRLGYKKHTHTAAFLTLKAALAADLIVCMTAEHKRLLGIPNAFTVAEITGGENIPDPYGMPVEEYIRTAIALRAAVPAVIDFARRLAEQNDARRAAEKAAAKTKKRGQAK